MNDSLFKMVPNPLNIGPSEWQWPAEDEKLFCIFEHVHDIDLWLAHLDRFDVAVQAGGAVGVWPIRLSKTFKHVYTFEPQPVNYACLEANCKADNVTMYHAALSDRRRKVSIHSSIGERKNYGAGYIVDNPSGVDTMLIDELELDACDLICLDIEGAELEALKGAKETIKNYHPLIVIEDKPMPQLGLFRRAVGDPGKWLKQFGYDFIAKHRWDSVYL